MNFPNYPFWWHLTATIAVEVCAIAALIFAAQRAFGRAYWQRAVWRTAMICLLLLAAAEWTGFGRGAVGLLRQIAKNDKPTPIPKASLLPSGLRFTRPAEAVSYPVAARKLPVWWPGAVWLAGTVVVFGRILAAQGLLIVLRCRRAKIVDDELSRKVRNIGTRLGLRRKVCLLRLPQSITPMAFGILRPCVGLPSGFETGFNDSEQAAILAHELAHLAARDPLWFLAADVVSAFLWWHPLAWWARRSLHVASELAADEASALVPDGPHSLAQCLVALGRRLNATRGWGWIGADGGFRSKLGDRVERLMRMSDDSVEGWPINRGGAARIVAIFVIAPALVLLFAAFQTTAQEENGWHASWKNSPAAMLALAAQDDAEKPESITARIQRAKLDYEMGRLDEAETILKSVLKDEPSNRPAPYFLDLIAEARMSGTNSRRLMKLGAVHDSVGRQINLSKVNSIHMDLAAGDLPLGILLKQLTAESAKRDPEGKGIKLLIVQDTWNGSQIDRAFVDVPLVSINIHSPLQNLPLADILNTIVRSADRPIQWTAESYSVVFSAQPHDSPAFNKEPSYYTRVFHGDPTSWAESLKQIMVTNSVSATNTSALLMAYLASAGVNLAEPGKHLFLNGRTGLLMVRASREDLETIEQAVSALYRQPPQVCIEAKFVEMSQKDSAALGFNWFLQGNATNLTGVMTASQFSAAINAIKLTSNDILTPPKVSVLSGRQAHAGDMKGANEVTVDVLPDVGSNGFSITLFAEASIRTGNQIWQADASREIWDGQTLVISQSPANQTPETRTVLVFVTPRIIDAAGNTVHTDEELAAKR